MAKTKKNNKTILLVMSFFVFVFLLAVLRPRDNEGYTQVSIPDNRGFPKLTSIGNTLVASESGGGFYIFEWSNIAGAYSTFPSLSENSILLDRNPKISVSCAAGNLIALGEDGKKQFQISTDEKNEAAYLAADQEQKKIILAVKIRKYEQLFYSFKEVDIEERRLKFLCDSGPYREIEFRTFSLSEDASMLAAAGQREGRGYIAVIDVNAREVIWEREFPETTDFSGISISSDGQHIFAGSKEGTLSMIKAQTGALTKTVVLVKEPRKTTNSKAIQTVVSSPGGKWVTCVCDPEIFLIDQKTGTLDKTMGAGQKIVTGVVFSPDETKLATSDLRANGVIGIIDLDKIKPE